MITIAELILLGNTLICTYFALQKRDRTVIVSTTFICNDSQIQIYIQCNMLTVYLDDVIVTRRPIEGVNGDTWRQALETIHERIKEKSKADF